MDNTNRNPEPNWMALVKVNSTQPTTMRKSAPQATEDPISCLEKIVDLACKHPKETKAVAAGLAIATLLYIWWDSKNN